MGLKRLFRRLLIEHPQVRLKPLSLRTVFREEFAVHPSTVRLSKRASPFAQLTEDLDIVVLLFLNPCFSLNVGFTYLHNYKASHK